MLNPGEVRVTDRQNPVLPTNILPPVFTSPVAVVERWIGDDKIRLDVLGEVIPEGVPMLRTEVPVNCRDGKVHLRQPPGGVIGFLPVDRHTVWGNLNPIFRVVDRRV